MLQHPSTEKSFNQQTTSVYERPASMKNWRRETMLSQDCSLNCQGIRKWRVQCPIPQVQELYDLLLKMELGRRPSFKRTSESNAPTSKSRNNSDFLSKMKLGRRPSFKRTSPMLQYPRPETIMISYQKWSWAEGPASKGQVQCFNTKSRNDNDSWLKMKLGRRPSFMRTSPILLHPSSETMLISN